MSEGITKYTTATAKIFFTGSVDCAHCPLLETYSRKMCRGTGEYILDDRGVGGWCPLFDESGKRYGIYYEKGE